MSREEREQLAEDRRSGIPLHRLDNSLFGAAYFATYVAGPWPMLDVSPAMWAHGTSIPLTMFAVQVFACRMRRLRTADGRLLHGRAKLVPEGLGAHGGGGSGLFA